MCAFVGAACAFFAYMGPTFDPATGRDIPANYDAANWWLMGAAVCFLAAWLFPHGH